MVGWLRRRRALRQFVRRLPLDLIDRYGRRESYSAAQVRRTLDDCHYTKHYRGYAYVLYLSRADAIAEIGVESVCVSMRQELAAGYFDGELDFIAIPERPSRDVGNFGGGPGGGV